MDPAAAPRPPAPGPAVPPGDRPGIFGAETEYLILYLPEDAADRWMPSFDLIEEIVFEALLEGRKAAVSSGLKGGYFLENGGLVHLEVFLRTQADTPIIEAATPECRSPRDVLVYQRAFDRILTEISAASRSALRRRGFSGRIAFGKNNRDIHGVGYGCHENYLIQEETGPFQRFLMALGTILACLLLIPSALFLLLVFICVIAAGGAARFLPRLAAALQRLWMNKLPHLRSAYFITMNTLLFLPISSYSLLLRITTFRRFQRDLTSFLVTRQLLAGAGGLDLKRGCFEIAQRPRLTSSLGEIVMFGRHKTMFDLKGLLYDPLCLFRSQKKLSITLGDSNLSDIPFFLKMGTTALVIEMIEAGVEFEDLRLRRPVSAFRAISRGGPWKEVAVRGRGGVGTPGRMTAIDIQREYFRRAREFFASRPEGRVRHREILDHWQETLDLLGDQPGRLSDRLDWAAKKALLDRAVLSWGNWREFFAWSRFLSHFPRSLQAESGSLESLLSRLPTWRRLRARLRLRRTIRRDQLDTARYASARDLCLLCQTIDLRYHELGADPGYQRQLEADDLLRRLTSAEEVARAAREPPPDTRARIRSYYIGLGQNPESIRANWSEVEISGASRSIPLPDPFQFRIPTD